MNMLFQLQNSLSTPILLSRVISAIMALIPIPRQASNIDKAIPVHGYRKAAPGDLIDLAIESRIARIIKRSAIGGDDPFFVADLGQIVRQHRRWIQNMPGIRPFYGMLLLSGDFGSCSRLLVPCIRCVDGKLIKLITSGQM